MRRRTILAGLAAVIPGLRVSAASWQTVKSWAGTGMKETETFEVSSREWRINWTLKEPAFEGAGLLQVYVHGENDQLISLAANSQQPGSDTSYVRGKGRFYLKISSANCKWQVSVEHSV